MEVYVLQLKNTPKGVFATEELMIEHLSMFYREKYSFSIFLEKNHFGEDEVVVNYKTQLGSLERHISYQYYKVLYTS